MNGVSRRQMLAIAAAAGTVGAIGRAQAAEDVLARVKKAGVLRVGTETYFAPFDFLKDGKATGLNYDILAGVGEALGVKVEYVDLPWEGVLPGLESGKFDMVSGPATITKARMERYRFTPPIAEATVALLKRANDKSIMKPADIAGKVVASGKATAQLAQLQDFAKTLKPAPTIREFPDFTTAYADMAAGRVSAVANSLPNIAFYATQQPGHFAVVLPPFGKKSYFGFIGRKDADYASLMNAVDAAILKMRADGRLAAAQKKWFGQSFDTPEKVTNPAV